MVEWALGIVASLLAGTNIYQLICYRSMKEKLGAEAKTASVTAHQKEIDLHQDQYDYLLKKLSEFQKLAELKSKLIYFKGLRCYRSDCSQRIRINPDDKKQQ